MTFGLRFRETATGGSRDALAILLLLRSVFGGFPDLYLVDPGPGVRIDVIVRSTFVPFSSPLVSSFSSSGLMLSPSGFIPTVRRRVKKRLYGTSVMIKSGSAKRVEWKRVGTVGAQKNPGNRLEFVR